jgi:hypothetical protein
MFQTKQVKVALNRQSDFLKLVLKFSASWPLLGPCRPEGGQGPNYVFFHSRYYHDMSIVQTKQAKVPVNWHSAFLKFVLRFLASWPLLGPCRPEGGQGPNYVFFHSRYYHDTSIVQTKQAKVPVNWHSAFLKFVLRFLASWPLLGPCRPEKGREPQYIFFLSR